MITKRQIRPTLAPPYRDIAKENYDSWVHKQKLTDAQKHQTYGPLTDESTVLVKENSHKFEVFN